MEITHEGPAWDLSAEYPAPDSAEVQADIDALDVVLGEMIGRCKELRLRAVGDEQQLKLDFAILLTVHTMHYVYRNREWHAL